MKINRGEGANPLLDMLFILLIGFLETQSIVAMSDMKVQIQGSFKPLLCLWGPGSHMGGRNKHKGT